jgi:hypothetical protein
MISIKNEDVESIYLLSTTEAEKLPIWVRANGTFWWLCSPGDNSEWAAAVYGTGIVDGEGFFIGDHRFGIRPALKAKSLDAMNFKVGEVVEVFHRMAQYIGNNSVLLCENIGDGIFDRESNNYKKSEIRKVVELWLEGKKI